MSALVSKPAVVVVGPNSELTAGSNSNVAPVASCSASSSGGMSGAIAVPVTTPMRRPSCRAIARQTLSDPLAQHRHRSYAVLDLREVPVVRGFRQRNLRKEIQLVRSVDPRMAPLRLARARPTVP